MNVQLKTDFEKLGRALARLEEVVSWPESHDGRVEAAIQCFEFVIELYWKLLKHMLHFKGTIIATPRDAFRDAFAAGWIDNEQSWVRMLKDRNLSSHTYNEDLAQEILGHIPGYLPLLSQTFAFLKVLAEKEFTEE